LTSPFWNYLSKESITETNPFFKSWWDYWHGVNRAVASGESARRYYSANEFAIFGVPNVSYPHGPTHATRFSSSPFGLVVTQWVDKQIGSEQQLTAYVYIGDA
jgi:hypothetical protein